ncbi:MAG: class I SAM-dependent rRNA methyltransferase [Planctomycetes bacterium]|nr:class I SAM-dependent rRNA methyltransferase [Planctomycetota bacterium]
MGSATLTGRGRRRLLGGHPWIYADDVQAAEAEPGALVVVLAPDGGRLGWALFSSKSRIALRMVSRAPEEPGQELWRARARAAVAHRRAFGLLGPRDACRLLFGDADGFPGLVVDRYADALVLQSGCQGSDRHRDAWLAALEEALELPMTSVLDRSDSSTRAHEELEKRVEWLRGERHEPLEVHEAERPGAPALVYEVSLSEGHKTGHYLDQRENRAFAARFASGARVLDAFSYDGLFGIRAALAGASEILCIDQSQEALERALRNAERNGVAGKLRTAKANAMHDLRARFEAGERYGLVVVDPPAFARSRREVEGALRGYRELNRRALGLLEPEGVLVSASCSHNVARGEFLDALGGASLDEGRAARIFRFTGAAPDHPVLATLPESEYLKCAFVRA